MFGVAGAELGRGDRRGRAPPGRKRRGAAGGWCVRCTFAGGACGSPGRGATPGGFVHVSGSGRMMALMAAGQGVIGGQVRTSAGALSSGDDAE